MRFVALGDVMVDVVSGELPAAGVRVHTDVAVRAGGSAVNAARCAVKLGASAIVVGRVGSDAAGELVRHSLLDAGIAAHLARDEALPTGVAIALGSGQGAGIVAARGANARLAETDIPDPIDGDALLVSGFALFQEGSAAAARAGLRRFRGQWSAIDLASPRLVAGVDLSDVAEDARVVFATTDEAKAVTGADAVDAASQLAEHFQIACVKLGDGAAVAAREGLLERASTTPVDERSPFGGGDAFAAAFLVAAVRGDALAEALQQACEAGARVAGRL